MRRALAAAIALCLAVPTLASAATPPPAASASSVTSQLPAGARPLHYRIHATPDAAARTFKGEVAISVEVERELDALVLHALELEFGSSSLVAADGSRRPLQVTVDADSQTARFAAGQPIAPGRYTLETAYSGRIGSQANGLFALDYPTADGQRTALYTQFENSDARRFIPSWDEPYFKATFDLSLTVPEQQMAVSNMPVASTRKLGNGLQQVSFATTPKMSTYLLFLGVGDFERASVQDPSGVEIGVIAQKGKVGQADYALQASGAILREFNDYFGVAYPLPKLDNIAAPGRSQFFSAMENWGAIFTFESALLLDPAVSGISDQQAVFEVAAHEIAHQWFGNLVTMAWWDDLWLNEGFASWLENRTTQKFHPEWDQHRVAAAYTSRGAMDRDAYATTHPVVQHVETVEQASQAFDGITYGKGAAVIAMLEDYVGAEAWQAGVRRYIARHAYGNAVTDQLWEQIDAAAPGKHFLQVAHDFTLQPGVPLIKLQSRCVAGRTEVSLTQGEYSIDNPGKAPLRWQVPVSLRAGDGPVVKLLVDGSASATFDGCDAPVIANAGQTGYFRTQYAPAQFRQLAAGYGQLPVVDQLGVLLDVAALAKTGAQPEGDLLDLVAALPADAATDLWQVAARTLGGLDGLYDGDAAAQAAYRRFALSRLSPLMARLGWDTRAGDSAQTRQLRGNLIATLSRLGDEAVVAEARKRFAAFQADPAAFEPELRRSVLSVVASHADAATWDSLRAMANRETSSLVRQQYFQLLGQPRDEALAKKALALALTDEPGATGGAALLGMVAREHPALAFDFAVAHRGQVDRLVDSTSRARYYPGLAAGSDDPALAARVRAFAEEHIAESSRRDAQTVVSAIQTAARLRAERRPQVDAWLKSRGY